VTLPDVAPIVAVPGATVITRPVVSTVATVASLLTHVILAEGISTPRSSYDAATKRTVSSSATAIVAGESSMRDTGRDITVTVVLAVRAPQSAVT
jgi:hypothetical protein